jgi:hypothetical protein
MSEIELKGFRVNCDTGETEEIEDVSRIITKQQEFAIAAHKEAKANKEHCKRNSNKLGGFVFMRTLNPKKKISAQTLGRLAYLSVYMDYDNNRLMRGYKPIYKQELSKLLKIPQSTVNDFLKETQASEYLRIDEYGYIYLSDFFFKGKSKIRKKIQLFIDPIKSLYDRITIENQKSGRKSRNQSIKHFGYVIQLVPHVNKEWNIICHNPDERDIIKVLPMSIYEICHLLKVSPSHSDKLVNSLMSISFIAKQSGGEQALCNFIKDRASGKYRMIINPDVLYMGVHSTEVKGYAQFFPVKYPDN